MGKVKAFLTRKKAALLMAVSAIATMACSVAVSAAEGGSGTANDAVVSAMTKVANDSIATGNAIIPIALGVVGLAMVVVFGIKIFKKIFSK